MNEAIFTRIMIETHQKAIKAMEQPNAPKREMDSVPLRMQAIMRLLETKP